MLSIIYDDIVNKIEKAKYTMEEGLETKDRDEAVQALDKLLNTKVKEEGGKLIVSNDGSSLKNYIGKNKPLLNTLLFSREYTDRPQKEASKLPSVDIQRLQVLTKYKNSKELLEAFKKLDYNKTFKTEKGEIKPKYFKNKTIKVPEDFDSSKLEAQIEKLEEKYTKDVERIGIRIGTYDEKTKRPKDATEKMLEEYKKSLKEYREGVKKITDKIDKLKGKTKEKTIKIFKDNFSDDIKEFNNNKRLLSRFIETDDEGNVKAIEGLNKLIKDAPQKIKEMKSAQKDIDSKETDALSLFLNSPAPKYVGVSGSVTRRGKGTNYDILIYDLRKVLVLLLNAFGPEYKRQVNTMMEKIKDSLSNEMERLKDIKVSDETARAVQQEGKLTDEMDSFYTKLSKVLRELNSERAVVDFFKEKPFSKQRLIRMIMEDKDYLKYRIPKAKESDKLILLKDKMAEPSQIGDIKERLNKKNISKIITILIKNKISPSELFTVKDKATVKSKFKKYTDDLSDIVERVENMTINIKNELESQIDEAKEIIVIQEQIGKDDFTNLKQDLQSIDDKISAIKLKELETYANYLRQQLSKPIKEKESKEPIGEKDAEEYIKIQEMTSSALVEYTKKLRNLIEESEKQYKKLSEEYDKLEEKRFEEPQKYSARKEELKNFKTNQIKLRKDIVGFKRELYNVEAKLENLIRIVTVLRQKPLFEKFNEAFMSRDKDDIKRLENAMRRVKRILRAKEAPKGATAKRNLRRGK
tara:strand:- start:3620 stop:5872 length:2253 start_codon:yes stop_codon:yes gene_type:complete